MVSTSKIELTPAGPREQGRNPVRGRRFRARQQHRADHQPEAVARPGHAAELHDEGQAPEDPHRLGGGRHAFGELVRTWNLSMLCCNQRADRKSQCLGFCTADFWSSLA